MPLREVQFGSYNAASLQGQLGGRFLVFFSSRLPGNNSLWCPDCLAVENLIVNTFDSDSERAPSAVLVYVGQKSEWKTPDNIFRKEPWKVTAIPTIIKLDEAGKEVGRLVEGQIVPKELSAFIQ